MWQPRCLIVVAGLTGSGKTDLLHRLAEFGEQTIDLEQLANHRGSVFGAIGRGAQPSHRAFGDMVTTAWHRSDPSRPVWIEDEGPFLGSVGIPPELKHALAAAPIIELVAAASDRRARLLADYSKVGVELLVAALARATDRLGPVRAAAAVHALRVGELDAAATILIGYYDDAYTNRMLGCARDVIGRFDPGVEPDTVVAVAVAHVRRWSQSSAGLSG